MVDLFITALVPFFAIWLYEISNWIALVEQGYRASLTLAGWLPLGVAGTTTGSLSPLTKVIQVAVAIGILFPLGKLFSKIGLLIAETFILSTVGVYLASLYWESLFMLSVFPMVLHVGIFVAGACILQLLLLRRFCRFEPQVD